MSYENTYTLQVEGTVFGPITPHSSMKDLSFQNYAFQYQVIHDVNEFDSITYTQFYLGTQMEKRRKYILFGPVLQQPVPKPVFRIYVDIESPLHTKAEIRALIQKQVDLLHRAEEIQRGELV